MRTLMLLAVVVATALFLFATRGIEGETPVPGAASPARLASGEGGTDARTPASAGEGAPVGRSGVGKGGGREPHAPRRAPVGDDAAAALGETPGPDLVWHAVELRIVDGNGCPVDGVVVDLRANEGETSATTAADGVARLALSLRDALAADATAALEARHPRYTTRVLRTPLVAEATTWLGDVLVLRGASVTGRLTGSCVAGALVRLYTGDQASRFARRSLPYSTSLPATRTDDSGNFRFDGLEPGEYAVAALSSDGFTGSSGSLALRAGDTVSSGTLPLAVREPEDSIEGRMLGPDGRPALDARVAWKPAAQVPGRQRAWSWLDTAADGSFVIELKKREPVTVAAWLPDGRSRRVVRELEPGARGAELEIEESRSIRILVVDELGAPLPDMELTVRLVGGEFAREKAELEYEGIRTGEDGRARIAEPDRAFRISAHSDGRRGYGGHREPGDARDTLEITATVRERREERNVLEPTGLRGRVVIDGVPVAGARATVHNACPPGRYKRGYLSGVGRSASHLDRYQRAERRDAQRVVSRTPPYAVLCRGPADDVHSTDERGEFLHLARPGTPWNAWTTLRVEAPGHASALLGPFTAAELYGDGVRELTIELVRTGAVEGRVLLPPGADTTGVVVGVSRGDGLCRSATVGPDGRFRLEGLPAGDWQIRRVPRPRSRAFELFAGGADAFRPTAEIEWDFTIRPGEVTRFDLDLVSRPTARVAGRVAIDGRDPVGWPVRVLRRDSPASLGSVEIAWTEVGADGRFELELAPTAAWIELASVPPGFVHWLPVDLTEGSNAVAIRLATGDLAWEAPWPGDFDAHWGTPDGAHGTASVTVPANHSHATFETVPAGMVRIVPDFGPTRGCGFANRRPNEFYVPTPSADDARSNDPFAGCPPLAPFHRGPVEVEVRAGELVVVGAS